MKIIDQFRWRHGPCGLARRWQQRNSQQPAGVDIRHGGNIKRYYDEPHDATGRFDFVLANPTRSNPALRDWRGQFPPEFVARDSRGLGILR